MVTLLMLLIPAVEPVLSPPTRLEGHAGAAHCTTQYPPAESATAPAMMSGSVLWLEALA